MERLTVDRQSRLIYYDNPIGYKLPNKNTAVVDTLFRGEELEQCLQSRQMEVRWEEGVYDRLSSGQAPVNAMGEALKQCRVWQLQKGVDVAMRFIDFATMQARFGEPGRDNYHAVYSGQLGTNDLEEIYVLCRDNLPEGYRGHWMSLGDVVELYDENGSEFYYCDRVGFRQIDFDGQEQHQALSSNEEQKTVM